MTTTSREDSRVTASNRSALIEQRATNYLSAGGLFNPELANHDAVRDLIIDMRDEIKRLRAEMERPTPRATALADKQDADYHPIMEWYRDALKETRELARTLELELGKVT